MIEHKKWTGRGPYIISLRSDESWTKSVESRKSEETERKIPRSMEPRHTESCRDWSKVAQVRARRIRLAKVCNCARCHVVTVATGSQ